MISKAEEKLAEGVRVNKENVEEMQASVSQRIVESIHSADYRIYKVAYYASCSMYAFQKPCLIA